MRIYVTADDFGRDAAVNAAVERGYRSGVLNSASLIVTGEAWREAAAMARGMAGLRVGLHVVVSDGCAALAPERIPHLVDKEGRFEESPARAGLRYWFSRPAREELAAEIEAQFERFGETGLAMAHVDGHQHLHMHPVVFDIVVRLAERWGVKRIRVPRDELGLALRFEKDGLVGKVVTTCVFRALERRARRRLQGTGIGAPGRTYGFLMSGRMEERYVAEVLREMRGESAEIYFHPRAGERVAALGANPTDLESLLSARVRELLRERSRAGVGVD